MIISLVLLVFSFRAAFINLYESVLSFGRSGWAYIQIMFLQTVPTARPIAPPSGELNILPDTSYGFGADLGLFFRTLVSAYNLHAFGALLNSLFLTLTMLLPFMILSIVMLKVYITNSLLKKQNNRYNKDTKPLKAFKWCLKRFYYPVKHYLATTIHYLLHSKFKLILVLIWLFSFNVFAIILHAIGFLLYFSVALDFVALYYVLYQIAVLLVPAVTTIPRIIWVIVALRFIHRWRVKVALNRLRHMEAMNKGFINARDLCVLLTGSMGKKKTTIATDMALSTEAYFRYKAYELMFDNDLKFPYFPFILLENVLKKKFRAREIFNLASCVAWVDSLEAAFNERNDSRILFGYDYAKHGLRLDDGKIELCLFDMLREYCQAYLIYTVKSSLIFSNYSVRTDFIECGIGNFPAYDLDFFNRDSKRIKLLSRHAHILDFDMVRLGKKMIKNNAKSGCFEFGIINITEVGKERGNQFKQQELKDILQELKANAKAGDTASDAELKALMARTNVLKDKFNNALKLIRHKCTVGHVPFARVFMDDQRQESVNADLRELCEVVSIEDGGDERLAMPLFFIEELMHDFLLPRFKNTYKQYRINRGDNTLLIHIYKRIASAIKRHRDRMYNRFGYYAAQLQVNKASGGAVTALSPYFLMHKKIFSNRFATDAYKYMFAKKTIACGIGVDDIFEYESFRGTAGEFNAQHSFFYEDEIKKYEDF